MLDLGLEEKSVKDAVGQIVKVGDNIAMKYGGYADMKIERIESFTLKGMPRYRGNQVCRSTFVKIFEQ